MAVYDYFHMEIDAWQPRSFTAVQTCNCRCARQLHHPPPVPCQGCSMIPLTDSARQNGNYQYCTIRGPLGTTEPPKLLQAKLISLIHNFCTKKTFHNSREIPHHPSYYLNTAKKKIYSNRGLRHMQTSTKGLGLTGTKLSHLEPSPS
ncbi:hypothetical protein M758_1G120100 [Ceratodon purpureus]|nr:hypothetical protein M758_1G120100 [Ceratodon purpureus]